MSPFTFIICYIDVLTKQKEGEVLELEECIARVQSGEVEKYAVLVERYQHQMFVYCCRLLGHEQEAEDAVQDIMVKAYEAIGKYKPEVNFSSWLYKIAYHHCINMLRRKKLQQKMYVLFKPELSTPSPEQELDHRQFSAPLAYALRALTPEERGLLVLRVFEELSYTEISEVQGSQPAALKKRMERLKKKIQRLLLKWEEREEWEEKSVWLEKKI